MSLSFIVNVLLLNVLLLTYILIMAHRATDRIQIIFILSLVIIMLLSLFIIIMLLSLVYYL
jgi:hypothetical protein